MPNLHEEILDENTQRPKQLESGFQALPRHSFGMVIIFLAIMIANVIITPNPGFYILFMFSASIALGSYTLNRFAGISYTIGFILNTFLIICFFLFIMDIDFFFRQIVLARFGSFSESLLEEQVFEFIIYVIWYHILALPYFFIIRYFSIMSTTK